MTESEIDKDWKAFAAIWKDKEVDNMGHTALRHDGQLITIYNDCSDAYTIGVEKFGLGHFPIKTFGERPKSLGAFTPHPAAGGRDGGPPQPDLEWAGYGLFRGLSFLD